MFWEGDSRAMLHLLAEQLPALGRLKKRAILIGYDLFSMVIALWAAFSTRLGVLYLPPYSRSVLLSAGVSFIVGIAALYRLRIYHIVLRYFDLRTVTRLLAAAAVTSLAWVALVYELSAHITVSAITFLVPRSVAFIYCGFLFLMLFMGRYTMALLLAGAARDRGVPDPDARAIVIFGANATGISLADSVRASRHYRLAAFVDPDAALKGQVVAGVPICTPEELPALAAESEVREVFLALPRASRSERLSAISQVRDLGLEVKTVPAPEEIVSGRFTVSDIRAIDVGDLLRRDPVEPIEELIREGVEGRSILVTGAGGSIGAELCRQVIAARAARLVLLDHSEFALYSIHQQLLELADRLPHISRVDVVPVVGSMLNDRLVRRIIADNDIDTLFHAAAYKHVPLLEENELTGIENNVFGTLAVVRAALDAKLNRFTMISTDKAVRPTSVMGASKRVAELVVQAFADRLDCSTQFAIVRFGNVLDSSGSVVQRFRNQIRAGGPITVTHPEVTRYFMSIPEATQLVLQASAMGHLGEVFVLDMGEPVKIVDLARHMVNLSGMSVRDADNPSGDIEISYVGLRPGEKLYEELFLGHGLVTTNHPRIRKAKERVIQEPELELLLNKLKAALDCGNRALVRRKLAEFIAEESEEGSPGLAIVPPSLMATDG
jgi:FlaA1/EpsC-like NDP-sugar epimerase